MLGHSSPPGMEHSMIRPSSTLALLFLLLALSGYAKAQAIETGKFHFYETKQIRGEEDYTITRTSSGDLLVQAKISLPFAGDETKPLVNATLRTKADSTPLTFEITGPTLLDLQENTSVQVKDQSA